MRSRVLNCALIGFLSGSAVSLLWPGQASGQVNTCPLSGATTTDCNGNGMDDVCDISQWTGLAPPMTVSVGTGPAGIVAADLNGDGKIDLATINASAGTVTILLNTGTSFTTSAVTVPAQPLGLAAGDFNRDGRVDLAVCSGTGNSVSILTNTGNDASGVPQFTISSPIQVGTRPVMLVAADFNGDGTLDLVAINQTSNNVTFLINTAGTFAASPPQAVGVHPTGAAAGDLDKDGKPDLVVANLDSDNVSILLSSGATSPPTTATFSGPIAPVTGDFTGDGLVDVAIANLLSNNIIVLKNTGGGVMQALSPITVGEAPVAMATADMDGDGKPDLVIAHANTTGLVTVLHGNGDGTFSPHQTLNTSGTLSAVVTASLLTGGAGPDVAVTNEPGNTVLVLPDKVITPTSQDCNGIPAECSATPCSGGGGATPGGGCGAGSCGAGTATLAPFYFMGPGLRRFWRRRHRHSA